MKYMEMQDHLQSYRSAYTTGRGPHPNAQQHDGTAHQHVGTEQMGDWLLTVGDPAPPILPTTPEMHRTVDLVTLALAAIGGALLVFITIGVWA